MMKLRKRYWKQNRKMWPERYTWLGETRILWKEYVKGVRGRTNNKERVSWPIRRNPEPVLGRRRLEDWSQQRWPMIEKEVYAIMYAVQKLDYYLSGAVFTIKTDHKPLKYLLEAEWTNKKIQQWVLNLSGTCVDLLSRIPEQLEAESIHLAPGVDDRAYQVNVLNAHTLGNRPSLEENQTEDFVTLSDPHWRGVIKSSQKDEEVLALRKKVKAGKAQKYLIHEDILYYLSGAEEEPRLRMFVAKALRTEILEQSWEDGTYGYW